MAAPDLKLAAVKRGSLAEVKAQVGPQDLEWRDAMGRSLLFFAVGRDTGTAEEALEVCRYLVEELGMGVDLAGGPHTLLQTPLFYAASTGFPQVSGYLLDRGASLQAKDQKGWTVLFWAASNCNLPAMELLLSRGVDPTCMDPFGKSALFFAASAPRRQLPPVPTETQCQCLRLLLRAQCPADSTDSIGQTPLFYAAKTLPEKVECLLDYGATVNLRDRNGQTALLYATQDQVEGTCRLLLERRADPNLSSGATPFSLLRNRPGLVATFEPYGYREFLAKAAAQAAAAAPGALGRAAPGALGGAVPPTRRPAPKAAPAPVAERPVLRQRRPPSAVGAPPAKRRQKGAPPLDDAEAPQAGGDDDMSSVAGSCVSSVAPGALRSLLQPTGDVPERPLELAAGELTELSRAVLCSSASEVERLIAAGHSPRELNTQTGGNLVLVAAMRADGDDAAARDICRLLVESHKVSPTYIDKQFQTPLVHAAQRGLALTVAYLLEAGCDPARRDDRERTPLHHAAGLQDAGCARALLERGCDVDAADRDGRTALAVAAARGCPGTLSLLLERGARVGDSLSRAAVACIEPLIAARCDPDAPGANSRLPLLVAAEEGSQERVAALLRARADVHRREDATGRTALHCAVKGKHLPVCRALLSDFGADAQIADAQGKTPLEYARSLRWAGAKVLDSLETLRQEQRAEAERARAKLRAQQRLQLAAAVRHGPLEQVRDLLQAAGATLREPLGADVAADPKKLNPLLPLHAAASRAVPPDQGGALEACQLLVGEGGLDPGERNAKGQTALFEAAEAGHAEVCEFLASRPGSDGVDAADEDGHTALFNAARCGRATALGKLLECRADVSLVDKQEQTALFPAARATAGAVDCIALLLAARCRPGAVDILGRTPLSYAAQGGLDGAVRALASARASVNTPDRGGRSALFYAVRETRVPMATLLLEDLGARPPSQGDKKIEDDGRGNRDLFDMARDRGYSELVRLLEEASNKHKERLALVEVLLKAVREGSPEELDGLLAQKASVHETNNVGLTLLHLAACRPDAHGEGCCRRLLEAQADASAQNNELEETPLFGAAREGSEATLALLLDSRCDPGLGNRRGENALFAAARAGRELAVSSLLRRGARADYRDHSGQSAAFHAGGPGCSGALRRLLQEAGACDAVDSQRRTPLFAVEDAECARVLVECGLRLDAADRAGKTALFHAAEGERTGVVRVLLDGRAQVSAADETGKTALHWAKGSEVPRLLLGASAPVDHQDQNGQTPLFYAAARDDEAMVQTLSLAGANGAARDINRQTPLFYAAQAASLPVVRRLVCQAFSSAADVDDNGSTPDKIASARVQANPDVVAYLESARRSCAPPSAAGRGRGRGGRGGRGGVAARDAAPQPKRYCLMFSDPADPTGRSTVPFGGPQFEAALAKLVEARPEVFGSVWPAGLPLSQGPPELEEAAGAGEQAAAAV